MLLGEHYAKPPIWLIIISLLNVLVDVAVEFGQVGDKTTTLLLLTVYYSIRESFACLRAEK